MHMHGPINKFSNGTSRVLAIGPISQVTIPCLIFKAKPQGMPFGHDGARKQRKWFSPYAQRSFRSINNGIDHADVQWLRWPHCLRGDGIHVCSYTAPKESYLWWGYHSIRSYRNIYHKLEHITGTKHPTHWLTDAFKRAEENLGTDSTGS